MKIYLERWVIIIPIPGITIKVDLILKEAPFIPWEHLR